MRKLTYSIICLCAVCLFVGCGDNGYTLELSAIDSIINEKPDSALRLLDNLSPKVAAFRANKPVWGIYNIDMIAGICILMKMRDSAEIILKSVLEQYRKYGFEKQALRYSRVLSYPLIFLVNTKSRLYEVSSVFMATLICKAITTNVGMRI